MGKVLWLLVLYKNNDTRGVNVVSIDGGLNSKYFIDRVK